MKSPREIEIKLKVDDPRTLKRRFKECGFAVVEPRHLESNIVLDFRDSRLRRSRSLLRLRTEGRRRLLTFKGPPEPSNSYKIRTEIETEIQDEGAAQRIFEALGLRVIFRYQKYRTVYAEQGRSKSAGQPLLVYDETPIGRFVELEGSKKWIDRVARRLGYEKGRYITASYAALYQDYCRRQGIKAGDMMFSEINS